MLKPYDYYQYWRNTEDADVGRFLKLYTVMKLDEIAKLEKLQGQEINEAKRILAFEATKLCHGEAAAQEAMETAQKVFEQGGVGEDLPVVYADLKKPVPFIDLLVQAGLAPSKGEARRLVQGGGAKCNDQPVTDAALTVSNSNLTSDGYIKLSAGKKRHALVKVK
jgi:tyrosyl-tRNA synthetase